MQISTDSWHFKLVARNTRSYRIPTNLCPYMRRLFWLMLVKVCMVFCWTAGGIIAASVLLAPLAALVHSNIVAFLPSAWLQFDNDGIALFAFAALVGVICYGIAGVCIAAFGVKEGIERFLDSDFRRKRHAKKSEAKRNAAALPPKTPSVFVEWVKGLHNKTCSSLEFVDTPASS